MFTHRKKLILLIIHKLFINIIQIYFNINDKQRKWINDQDYK